MNFSFRYLRRREKLGTWLVLVGSCSRRPKSYIRRPITWKMKDWEIEGSGSSLKILLVGDTHFITSHIIPPADPLHNFFYLFSVFLKNCIGMLLEVKA